MTKRRKLLNLKRFIVHSMPSNLLSSANSFCPSGSRFLRMSVFGSRITPMCKPPVSECAGWQYIQNQRSAKFNQGASRLQRAPLRDRRAPTIQKLACPCRTVHRSANMLKLIRTVGRHEQMLKEKGCRGGIGINYGPIGRI